MSVMKPETQEAFDQYKELSSIRPLADVRELKDCPFCGGEVEFLSTTLGEFSTHHWIKGVQCTNPVCKAQTVFFRGSFNVSDMSMPREMQKAQIAEWWNKRA